jgi:fructose-specific phosphotransferase system IIC component
MNPKYRMLLYALAGIAAGLGVKFATGWHWDWPMQTVTGNVFYVVGYLAPFVLVALLVGYLNRKRPNSN